jgi:hypothetical protein
MIGFPSTILDAPNVEFKVTFEMYIMTIYNPPVDYIFWSM